MYLVYSYVKCAPEKSPQSKITDFCQLGLSMDDSVDSLLSVIIFNTKSHTKMC